MSTDAATTPELLDADAVAEDFGSDPETGLSSSDAQQRRIQFGPNLLDAAEVTPTWRKILAQFADPLVYLLLAAVVVSVIAWAVDGAEGMPYDAIVILVIVIANAIIGYTQEAKAEAAVEALQRMATPLATVVRDGLETEIPAEDVVPGDILLLSEGDSVAADGRLLEAASLSVAESSLTGESEPVLKDVATLPQPVALGDRVNMVFNGTAVTRGRGRAVVTATGMQTEMGRIADLLSRTEDESTPLQREIDRIGRLLGQAVIVIALVVIVTILATSDVETASEVVDVLLLGVSLAVAAVPEGLPAILSVVLAVGVQRMAKHNAIVKNLSSVETLGSASVICSDKTGTLTRNEMTIERIRTASGEVRVTGVGYSPVGDLVVDGRPLADGALRQEATLVLGGGSLANDAVLREEDGDWVVHGDPTEAAFLVAERKAGITDEREARFARVGEVAFSSERKLMSSVESDRSREGRIAVVTKGAPDVLLGRCTHEQVGEEVIDLADGRRQAILADVDELSDQAFRTLAVAYRPLPDTEVPPADESLEHQLVYTGMVGIIDPARAEAAPAIAEAHSAGIRVIMITGDHPRTAARIATDLGIVSAGAPVLTGLELDAMDDSTFVQAVRDVSVYARVAPEHKLRIVDALQTDRQIVAMTGDGVNDAPALKSADIGVAMGIAGTDVTKEAANMILADDNFATIVEAVRQGRLIFANIKKFLRYLLSSNAGEVLTVFFGVVLASVIGLDVPGETIVAPLLATQILWINLLTDSGPALAMGVDPPMEDPMKQPPRSLDDRIIDAQMWGSVMLIGVVMAIVTLLTIDMNLPGGLIEGSGDITEARTAGFTVLVIAQLFNAFNSRSVRVSAFHHLFVNRLLWGAIALSVVLQVLVVHVPFLNDAFDTSPLSLTDWAVCVAMASAVLWVDELKKLILRLFAQV